MLRFDEATSRILEEAYAGQDFTRRRHANLIALDPAPGTVVADIGTGAGHGAVELARRVGPEGRVHAVDPSADMRARAEAAVARYPQVTVAEGTAGELPLGDASLDGAMSIQVMEYVAEIDAALAEAARVIRPGGRLVIGDMHFDTLVWASDEPQLMTRIEAAWDGHFVWRDLPAHLPERMARAGFQVDAVEAVPFVDRQPRADGLARMMSILMPRFAVEAGAVTAGEAAAWQAEQAARAREGRFFFSLTHFVVRGVRRP